MRLGHLRCFTAFLAFCVIALCLCFGAPLLFRVSHTFSPPLSAGTPPFSCGGVPYTPPGFLPRNGSGLDPCALPAVRAGAGGPALGFVRAPRDVARRARFAAACASLHPYSANVSEGPPLETRRALLVEHGARVSAALAAWLAPLRLPPPQHLTSLGYTGPFLEDMWRAEFMVPVRYALPRAAAEALAAEVAGVLGPPGAAGGARFEDAPLGSGSAGALAAPYDAELFHPFVPLFIPWERLFVADSIRAGAAAHKREVQRVALQARQIARLNSTYLRDGGGGVPKRLPSPLAAPTSAHGPALSAFPHLAALPPDMLKAFFHFLNATLRPDVAYVTVTQRPAGPWAEGLPQPLIRRVLWRTVVLSAGGGGHVALPLLGRELPLLRVSGDVPPPPPPPRPWPRLDDAPAVTAALSAFVEVPQPDAAAFALGFQGSARDGARKRATASAAKALGAVFAVNKSATPHPLEWVPPMVAARLVFAPRGVGATSFRLYEALQVGVPPVYVFDGPWPWLPYAHPAHLPPGEPPHPRLLPRLRDPYPAADLPPPPSRPPLWPALGYVLSERAFNASLRAGTLLEVHGDGRAAGAAWRAKRAAIEAARGDHFTYAGVAARVREWLEDPWAAELYCARPVPPFWEAWLTPLPCCAARGNASAAASAASAKCRPCGSTDKQGSEPGRFTSAFMNRATLRNVRKPQPAGEKIVG
jgi:hypothetical protein